MARPTSRLLQVGVLLASVLALCAVVWAPSALAGTSVGSFEIDGNLVDSPPGEPIDWSTPGLNPTNFNDLPSGRNDTSFGQGSKELEPGGWSCGTGGVPGKDNIVSGQVAFRTFDDPNDVPDAGPQQFAYVNFTRGAVNGDAHMDFEFNQSDAGNPADACQGVPIRTDGDLLITFDTENGGKTIIVRAFEWDGDSVSGTFVEVPLGTNVDGAVNIPNTIPGHKAGDFGEAAINLSETLGEIACGEFSVAYMKTRASTSITSELKDRTSPQTINVGDCPNSDLDKAVRNETDDGEFATSATADPGDIIEYQLTYTNNGTADAHNVTITEEVPDRSTFLSCKGPTGVTGDCKTTGTTPGSTITWDLGTVEGGGTRVVSFRTQLDSTFPPGETTIENVATVTSDEEPPPGKDSNPTTVVVNAAPDLTLIKSADVEFATVGDQITYTFDFANNGDADADDVVIKEDIPPGTEFVDCTGETGTTGDCTTTGDPVSSVSWSVGTVEAGETGSVTLTVEVTEDVGCQICNTATIESPDQDSGTPVPSNQVCVTGVPAGNPDGANANDSATGARLVVDSLEVNETLPEPVLDDPDDPPDASVRTSQSGVGSESENNQLLDVNVPDGGPDDGSVLQADLLRVTSTSTVSETPEQAQHVSTAQTAGLNVLNGVVTADTVLGVATATASGTSSSFSSAGSTFQNLRVMGGPPLVDVAPNTTIKLPAALFGGNSYVALREEVGSTSGPDPSDPNQLSGGTYAADLSVNMVHVKITDLDPLTEGNQRAEVIVSQAIAHADFPQTRLCAEQAQQAVSGHAFIASESTDPEILPLVEGFVSIPPTGADPPNTQQLASVALPDDGSVVSAGAAQSSSGGTLDSDSSDASSFAQVANSCVLPMGITPTCSVSAQLVRSQSNSTADASGASSNADGTQLVNVVVSGAPPIGGTPPPNTTIPLGDIGVVILNEQVCDNGAPLAAECNNGTGQAGLTVRAIHVILLDPAAGGDPGAEVIVAEAHSDAKFVP